jgi:hypothetical protein
LSTQLTSPKERFKPIKAAVPDLYFKLEQIGGEWVTRQLVYLSKTDVAAWLHISERSVYEYCNRSTNPLPYLRIPGGRELLFRPDEVERWLESERGDGV